MHLALQIYKKNSNEGNKASNGSMVGYTVTVCFFLGHPKDLHYDLCKTVRLVDTHRYKVYNSTLNVSFRTFRHNCVENFIEQ